MDAGATHTGDRFTARTVDPRAMDGRTSHRTILCGKDQHHGIAPQEESLAIDRRAEIAASPKAARDRGSPGKGE
jgi:hypothetical protein